MLAALNELDHVGLIARGQRLPLRCLLVLHPLRARSDHLNSALKLVDVVSYAPFKDNVMFAGTLTSQQTNPCIQTDFA